MRTRKAFSGNIGVIAAVLIGLVVLLVLMGVGGYNGLVTKETVVEQKAADLDSQMKRRADLVPNLVATVMGYAKHESGIFEAIAQSRAAMLSADVNKDPAGAAQANSAFNSSLGRLLAIAENYPNLKADQNFIRLQDELAGTENRINYARTEYNGAVKDFNVSVRTFPNVLLAGLMGFEKKESFEATEIEKATPQVEF